MFNICIIFVSGQGSPRWLMNIIIMRRLGTSPLTYIDVRPGTSPLTMFIIFNIYVMNFHVFNIYMLLLVTVVTISNKSFLTNPGFWHHLSHKLYQSRIKVPPLYAGLFVHNFVLEGLIQKVVLDIVWNPHKMDQTCKLSQSGINTQRMQAFLPLGPP